MKRKVITFDPHGNCPICHKVFKSSKCPHDVAYVEKVVAAANMTLAEDDIKKLVEKNIRKSRDV